MRTSNTTSTIPVESPPIACTLDATGLADRIEEFQNLFAAALRSHVREPTHLGLVFSITSQDDAAVRDVFERESRCWLPSGQVTRRAGVHVCYYEPRGLIEPPARRLSGQRADAPDRPGTPEHVAAEPERHPRSVEGFAFRHQELAMDWLKALVKSTAAWLRVRCLPSPLTIPLAGRCAS